MAGEGIEYSWGNSKIYLRGLPIEQRRAKAQFNEKVRLAVSSNEGVHLHKENVIKFSAQARDFFAVYHILHSTQNNNSRKHVQVTSLSKKILLRQKRDINPIGV
eukprot:13854568-Ditylum_brightwellii.AAC.1